jgi:hypothetical protein
MATLDLGADGPHVWGWTAKGNRKVRPLWTGPDGADKVHLMCGHGHEVQIRRERIIAALDAAPDGVTTIPLG